MSNLRKSSPCYSYENKRNQSQSQLLFFAQFKKHSSFLAFWQIKTYHSIVDFVGHHADEFADSIAQGNSSFDVLLGVVRPKNGHVYNLHCDLNISELFL